MSLYHDDSTVAGGTPLDGTNPINFGQVDKGVPSPTITIHVWNGKGDGSVGASPSPKLYSLNGPDDASEIFNGTVLNGFKSMLEVRSCAAFGTAADQQKTWTPISPNNVLVMGAMPANTMRTVEVRLNVPLDAVDMSLHGWTLRVSV